MCKLLPSEKLTVKPFNVVCMEQKTPYEGINDLLTAINGEFLKRQCADLRLATAKRHR